MTLLLAVIVYTFTGASLIHCADGDTCTFNLHDQHPVFGKVTWKGRVVRLAGLDAPELHPARCPSERELGERARDRLVALLKGAQSITLEVVQARDKFGRMVAVVRADGQDVAATLIAEGVARPYSGKGKRRGWC